MGVAAADPPPADWPLRLMYRSSFV
jgi:hypothetical protein